MKNYYLIDILIAANINEFIIPYDSEATIVKIDLYGLKVGLNFFYGVY